MFTLIKGAEVYSPEYLGKKDVLCVAGKVVAVDSCIDISGVEVDIIDANGKLLLPGFIDNHVHILGGGGEGGYKTRTPELMLSSAISAGVTTVVGCLGTDGVTRTMSNLVAKAKGLKEEGLSCFVYTGSYALPIQTLTGSVRQDIVMVDEIIGVGEIAVSDHRSSCPTKDELARVASDARMGGMLSGKAGVVNIHMGDSHKRLSLIEEVISSSSIPISQFIPTHINRNPELFYDGIMFAKKGGNLDFTTGITPQMGEGIVKCSTGLRRMMESGVDVDRITFSSDAQGSLPMFDEHNNIIGLTVGKMDTLFKEAKDAVLMEGIPMEKAITVITSNNAKKLKLKGKGHIAKGYDADIVLLDKGSLDIDTVIAMGRVMMKDKKILVKGTFE